MLLPLLLLLSPAFAQVTLYRPTPSQPPLPAEEPGLRLVPPPPPQPPRTSHDLYIPANPNAEGFPLSIEQPGNFLGFSIELSVATTLLGEASNNLKPPFLNYLANIQTRAGRGALVRVGGNTQDSSHLYVHDMPGAHHGQSVVKIKRPDESGGVKVTTPIISFSPDLLYTMANITALTETEWFFGLSFNQTDIHNVSSNIGEVAELSYKILGKSLRGLALGNEPDIYARHGKRVDWWGVNEYTEEFGTIRADIVANRDLPTQQLFLGPSVCCDVGGFQVEDVLNSQWLPQNINYLAAVTVQRYPNNNCQLGGRVLDPQVIFSDFLNHTSAQILTEKYLGASATVQAAHKDMIMLEMNTGSCGGFPGISDSFGATMWTVDWALQLAWGNFSATLIHVGGQSTYYNPFTPPTWDYPYAPWTTGSVYYSTLLVAEAFGSSGRARVADIRPSSEDMFHPAYLIYENDLPSRALLFNYVSDESGASDHTVFIPTSSPQVYVRYLRSSSVSEQWNITWAGQSMGARAASDGTMFGEQETQTVMCSDGRCAITVPAPSIALVFLTDEALRSSSPKEHVQTTYTTSVIGKGTAVMPFNAYQTGNGFRPVGIYGSSTRPRGAAEHTARLQIGIGIVVVSLAIAFAVSKGV